MKEESFRCGESENAPAAMRSASAVFPEPRAPITAIKPGLRDMTLVASHGAPETSKCAMVCEGRAPV
jgi:hypothetical protein